MPATAVRPLSTEVQFVPGVGPKVAQLLAKLEIYTLGDLLWHLPRRYEDRRRFLNVARARPGEYGLFKGKIITVDNQKARGGHMTLTKAYLDDGTGAIELIWFNQPWMRDRLVKTKAGVVVFGQVKSGGYSLQIETPEWEEASDSSDPIHFNRIVPIYPLTEGVYQKHLRRILYGAINLAETPPDILTDERLARLQLMPIHEAIRQVHFPDSEEQATEARRRLAFDEFLLIQTGIARQKAQAAKEQGIAMSFDAHEVAQELVSLVGFELTGAQKRCAREIWRDMAQPHPMNRLLQGDVGSGKTAVAAAALLAAVRSGYQAAIMAPTEILAEQHWSTLANLMVGAGIPVELMLGKMTKKQKEQARERVLAGDSMVAVGTHALIQEGVEFRNLGLVVIDEQHRFGVMQRKALRQKGANPHVLVMTATPIPRTLTMTIYGELDTSIIDEMPPGRKPVRTHWKAPDQRGSVYAGVRKLLSEGRQAYVICPLVEESEKLQAQAAEELFEKLRRDIFPDIEVGLLHGRMKPAEKELAMERFRNGDVKVLVATTVVEVGVDVPNATVMVIEDADRFGLAQLHQLRGRIGRGDQQSFCVMIGDPKSDDGRARLDTMVATTDGFRIAEEDLKLRGPGEIYGVRQSGMPVLKVGDLIQDREVLISAREEAFEIVKADPDLSQRENYRLREALENQIAKLDVVNVS
ncbi:MAG: ATP-dependent DNA helicase RecG [Armatimonadetes bacterium]|nr:ATP-dependent DNA helicase RecG [Armatimonadota bacterium]